jgi:DNA helicase-2/ATP-dependent DNA helicase PcrA
LHAYIIVFFEFFFLLKTGILEGMLNTEQKKAVSILNGPVLVLAGAGSGKTRVVVERIVELIRSGVSASSVLGLTFTNKAAKEMQERVHQITSCDVWVSTFHRLGARVLRESIHALGYTQNFLIYDEDDAEKVIKQCLEKMGVQEGKGEKKKYRQMISSAKNGGKVRDEFEEKLTRLYYEELKRCNAVDFDDLLLLPIQIFKEHPAILELYQARYSHLLVDEYQDTNSLQDEMISLLAGAKRNLFVVGDPDQSIYSWRGANISNIMNFKAKYPEVETIYLEENYRSQPLILEAANALIANNETRYEKNLWSKRPAGAKIKEIGASNEKEEAFLVTSDIADLKRKGVSYNEIAVLYRTNAQSRAFEDYLLSRGIPYVVVGGISFYQRKEIKDILAFLRLLLSDHDPLAFERVVNLLKMGLGKASLAKIVAGAELEAMPLYRYCKAIVEGHPLQHPVSIPTRSKNALSRLTDLVDRLRGMKESSGVADLIREVIAESAYFDLLKEDRETYQDKKENVEELVAKAVEWDLEERGDLVKFFEELSLKASIEEVDANQERVSLMTVHNSKGLEFYAAFLAGMEEDLFPHVNSREDDLKLEEERRLCYVAMTRAKDRLTLSYCRMRYLFGTSRFQRPSRFLSEIPKMYVSSSRY